VYKSDKSFFKFIKFIHVLEVINLVIIKNYANKKEINNKKQYNDFTK
jgi:hypothetical protein